MSNIIVTYDGYDYRVPAPNGGEEGAYYTDDREDVVGTIRNYMYEGQENRVIEIKPVKEHPSC